MLKTTKLLSAGLTGWLQKAHSPPLMLGLPSLQDLYHVTNYLIKKIKLWSRCHWCLLTQTSAFTFLHYCYCYFTQDHEEKGVYRQNLQGTCSEEQPRA